MTTKPITGYDEYSHVFGLRYFVLATGDGENDSPDIINTIIKNKDKVDLSEVHAVYKPSTKPKWWIF